MGKVLVSGWVIDIAIGFMVDISYYDMIYIYLGTQMNVFFWSYGLNHFFWSLRLTGVSQFGGSAIITHNCFTPPFSVLWTISFKRARHLGEASLRRLLSVRVRAVDPRFVCHHKIPLKYSQSNCPGGNASADATASPHKVLKWDIPRERKIQQWWRILG